jgi:hypothetical protein
MSTESEEALAIFDAAVDAILLAGHWSDDATLNAVVTPLANVVETTPFVQAPLLHEAVAKPLQDIDAFFRTPRRAILIADPYPKGSGGVVACHDDVMATAWRLAQGAWVFLGLPLESPHPKAWIHRLLPDRSVWDWTGDLAEGGPLDRLDRRAAVVAVDQTRLHRREAGLADLHRAHGRPFKMGEYPAPQGAPGRRAVKAVFEAGQGNHRGRQDG